MSDVTDPRHISRALALQYLFTEIIAKKVPLEVNDLLVELEVQSYDPALYEKLVAGVREKYTEIDPVIQELAPAWPLAQIAPVDLTLLRIGIWEGFVGQITPAKVVINEIIELAKQFGGPNSGSFVNGVLGSLINKPELQKLLSDNIITNESIRTDSASAVLPGEVNASNEEPGTSEGSPDSPVLS